MKQPEYNSFNVKLLSILAYIGPMFLMGKFSVEKENKSVNFHCQQGLRLFCTAIIMYVTVLLISLILNETMYSLAALTMPILILLVSLTWLAFSIIGIKNVIKNKTSPIPIIGFSKNLIRSL